MDKLEYSDRGYCVVKGLLSSDNMDEFEAGFARVMALQAYKIFGDLQLNRIVQSGTDDDFEAAVERLFTEDNTAFNEAAAIYERSFFAHKFLASSGIVNVCAELLDIGPGLVQSYGPHLLVNQPETQHRLYTWHTEAAWFPKRRRFVNVWFPVVRAKGPHNGTMYFKIGAHKREGWPFAEFRGYDRETLGDQSFYVQYEIPDRELDEYEEEGVSAERGDVIFFDRNLVHRSSSNTSNQTSYAMTLRCLDYGTDLTISGTPSERPYKDGSSNNGRPQCRSR